MHNLSEALTLYEAKLFINAAPKDGVFFLNRGSRFFYFKVANKYIIVFLFNFVCVCTCVCGGREDQRRGTGYYTCPYNYWQVYSASCKMGFLSIFFAQRRRHLKVFMRDVNIYTKIKGKITFGNRKAYCDLVACIHAQKTCKNMFEYQGLWVTNL